MNPETVVALAPSELKEHAPDRDSGAEARAALRRAVEKLRSLQHSDGWWKGELETNVTMDAEDLFLREFLGIRESGATERTAAWIRSRQGADGSWSLFRGGPADLSTTVEAYVALRLAGDSPDAEHMRAAAALVREQGGIEHTRVFTRVWLALFGAWPWGHLPALPPELMLLPRWAPLNIYDFACWARQTIVPLSIVFAHRPKRRLPFALGELQDSRPWSPSTPASMRARALTWLDRALHAYERRPPTRLRALALARAERWIVRRQEADGSWGGIQPPWVYSLIALHLCGYSLEHPVMRAGLGGLDGFTIEDGSRRLEACQSPVWDTALAAVALADAGAPADDPALVSAADWLLGEQVEVRGDWSVRRPGLEPGGWSFEFANDNYPDIDDTAEVVLALLRVAHPEPARVGRAIERAVRWVEGMQDRTGGWGAFDAGNTSALVRELPFCDFGEVIDPPSADVSAHALEMLAAVGRVDDPRARTGRSWLVAEQEPGGSWFGRWGVNHVYGTGAVLPALIAAGLRAGDPTIRRAVRWLEDHQNDDGGWGEDVRSYRDPAWIGRGVSTASQTAWALLALHAAGERSDAVGYGLRWLVRTQCPDGGWDEPEYTGTGFPSDFSINYHLYRLVFPIMALGRLSR
jgi:squalene-hopene/tetraprenyl-beta-curcumene cyclase